MIRPAVLSDSVQILGLIEPYLASYPLRPDQAKMRQTLSTAISSAQHFVAVDVNDDRIEGVLIGLTSANLWATKSNCNIVAWISKAPGQGAALLRAFRNWVRARPLIRVAGACPDLEVDERVWKLAERIGFEKRGGAYLLFAR